MTNYIRPRPTSPEPGESPPAPSPGPCVGLLPAPYKALKEVAATRTPRRCSSGSFERSLEGPCKDLIRTL